MTYQSIVEMTNSSSLEARIAACAADEGYPSDPALFARQNMWSIVAADVGWSQAWDSARASGSDDVNPDTGQRADVITDGMILAVVQPLVLEALEPPTTEGG